MDKKDLIKEIENIKIKDAKDMLIDVVNSMDDDMLQLYFSKYFEEKIVFVGLKKTKTKKNPSVAKPQKTRTVNKSQTKPDLKKARIEVDNRPINDNNDTQTLNEDDILNMLNEMENNDDETRQ